MCLFLICHSWEGLRERQARRWHKFKMKHTESCKGKSIPGVISYYSPKLAIISDLMVHFGVTILWNGVHTWATLWWWLWTLSCSCDSIVKGLCDLIQLSSVSFRAFNLGFRRRITLMENSILLTAVWPSTKYMLAWKWYLNSKIFGTTPLCCSSLLFNFFSQIINNKANSSTTWRCREIFGKTHSFQHASFSAVTSPNHPILARKKGIN